MERLDKRSLLAADIGEITGTAYIDLNGNGLDASDSRLGGVEVRLFLDGGDGVFGGDDTLEDTVNTINTPGATLGQYTFSGLVDGLYFVQQTNSTAPDGLIYADPIPVTISNRVQLIDDYLSGNQTASIDTGGAVNQVDSNSVAAGTVLGGGRDIQVTRTAGTNPASVAVNTTTGELSFSSGAGTDSVGLVQYDGNDGTITLDADGLGGISLAGGLPGETPVAGSALMLAARTNVAGAELTVRVYTDATNFSTFTQDLAVSGTFTDTIALFLSDFTVGGGTGADFNDVGAIEVELISPNGADSFVNLIETVRPDIQPVNLQNIQPLTIGNLIFQDNNNNGVFDAGDAGLTGVDVELYELTSLGATVNPATQTPVATVTSGAGGAYSFTNVEPGFYAIVIPAREFDATSVATGAGTLVGFQTSTPTPETAGANANVDNDDDGRAVVGQLYIASGGFELISGSEPTGGGNTNNTFDFGFVSNADLQLEKTFVSLGTALPNGTREATFRIDVTNNGPLTATGITVVDTLPTGLTFDRITTTTSTTTAPVGVTVGTVAGNNVTLNLANLADDGVTSFHIVTILAAGVFLDLTNSAIVDADQNDPVAANNDDDALLDLPQNDLSITKRLQTVAGVEIVSPATSRTGDTVVYRIAVENDAANSPTIDDQATGVTVVDTLPVGVTFVSGTINGGTVGTGITFNPATRQVTANVGTVNRGTPAIILLTVTVNSDAPAEITNTAVVSNSPDTDNNTANDTATVDNDIIRAVDLTIDKAVSTNPADNTTAIFGAPVTFTITVTNKATSPGVASGFTVTDTLPAGLTFVTGSFDAGTSGVTVVNNGQLLTFTGGSLAVGASATFTFDALVAQTAPASITNTAAVAPLGTDVDILLTNGDNDDDQAITPIRDVELVVAKSSNLTTGTPTAGGVTTDTASATPGGNLTYTIRVTNSGPSDAVNVNVVDTLPAGFTATSITIGGSQVTDNDPAAGILSFVIPSVPVGTTGVSVLVNGTIAPTATGNLTNSVTVSGGGVGDLPAGNTASVVTPLTPSVDLSIDKTGPATAIPGGAPIAYTMIVSNAGPSVATNVNFADDLPPGVTIQSVTLNGTAVTNTGTGGDVAFVIPTLGVGTANQATVVITVSIDPATTAQLTNTATVTLGTEVATDSAITTLTPTADVTVTKAVNNATAAPGGTLQYTIVVRNGGQSTATGVTLVDVLPTGVTFTSGTGPGGTALTATGQTINAAVGTLAPNATATYTINATIGTTTVGAVVNQATVATLTPEGTNALPNVANVTTNVDPGNYSITGRSFRDQNNNGLFDGTDVGVPNVTIELRVSGNPNPIQTTTTNANGNYSFNNLSAGSYTVRQIQPAGFRDGLEQAGAGATPANTADDTVAVNIPVGTAPATAFPSFNFADIELLSKRRFLASSAA